ncbi:MULTISPECIES: alanine/glycine:cation symporter family protein [Brevibacterium]|uniref:Amino acid carrier protein n=4 Tax=Bacteria TaxID=2 RepID=K9AQI0_9MICO|nr:alanine/glycine:cation symporter family protein [Brevibacterium casei]NJE66796.1 alanine:cation symporter family protein [Brevibacterium sp. LS14]EKU49539.1 amino acid carrier protein [Brevibacterium casei S18]KZE20873.1 D-alanine glycine permease [Brevibacterium casei]MBE4693615.1 alanine:cation symporter family protein [Brevibacterium casei]MBY3576738.1 alanine:cation symporter family protein [Brevibacterium casei]
MDRLLLASDAPTSPVDDAINAWFDPIATWFSSVIFVPVTIGEISFPFVVAWLIIGALIFTLYFGFIQFRGFKVSLEVVRGKYSSPTDPGEVTHFQALASALSGTVGLGNIAGVGVAVALGGPGATFWMIIAGLLGMCTKFVECTLGVKYREIDENGVVHGGPFKYLPVAFRRFSRPVAMTLTGIFAIAILIFGVVGGGMFQANQTFAQVRTATGGEDGFLGGPFAGLIFGILFALLVGLVILGGIRSIAKVTDKLVPAMGIFYVISCLLVLAINFDTIPLAIGEIFEGAFNPQGIAGGIVGVMIIGFQRSAFSNEAGIGSAAIAHSAVKTRRPISEGFVALLEPFIDTVVICTMTALTIIVANQPSYTESIGTGEIGGVTLASDAFSTVASWYPVLLAIAVALFAFSTLITWAYYGERAWSFLFGRGRATIMVFRVLVCVFVVIGCVASFSKVVEFADAALFMCAFINILGLYILMPVVKKELKKYLADRKAGTLTDPDTKDAVPVEQPA